MNKLTKDDIKILGYGELIKNEINKKGLTLETFSKSKKILDFTSNSKKVF